MSMAQKTLLLIGATSDIGHATAQAFAAQGWNVLLTARNTQAAERNRGDIAARSGAEVSTYQLDILNTAGFESFMVSQPDMPDAGVGYQFEHGVEHPEPRAQDRHDDDVRPQSPPWRRPQWSVDGDGGVRRLAERLRGKQDADACRGAPKMLRGGRLVAQFESQVRSTTGAIGSSGCRTNEQPSRFHNSTQGG